MKHHAPPPHWGHLGTDGQGKGHNVINDVICKHLAQGICTPNTNTIHRMVQKSQARLMITDKHPNKQT